MCIRDRHSSAQLLTVSSATDHFNADFPTTCKKIPRYSREFARQMAARSSSFTTFTACLSIGLLNSRLATSFSAIDGFHTSNKRQINVWLLSNRFVAFSSALFSFHRSIFISTVGFRNEENCCLSQEMGKLIKENLLKGIFRVD